MAGARQLRCSPNAPCALEAREGGAPQLNEIYRRDCDFGFVPRKNAAANANLLSRNSKSRQVEAMRHAILNPIGIAEVSREFSALQTHRKLEYYRAAR